MHSKYHLKELNALGCISNIVTKYVGNSQAWQGNPGLRMFVTAVALAVPDMKQSVRKHSFPCPAKADGSIPSLCETHQGAGTVGWCSACHPSRLWDRLPRPFCMSWHKGQVLSLIWAPAGQQARTMDWQMSLQTRQQLGTPAWDTSRLLILREQVPVSGERGELTPSASAPPHLPSCRCWLPPCPRPSCFFPPFS